MLTFLRSRWRQVSTGLLAFTLLGAGGSQVYRMMSDDCCAPGSPCCHPGSPCCHHATPPNATPPNATPPNATPPNATPPK